MTIPWKSLPKVRKFFAQSRKFRFFFHTRYSSGHVECNWNGCNWNGRYWQPGGPQSKQLLRVSFFFPFGNLPADWQFCSRVAEKKQASKEAIRLTVGWILYPMISKYFGSSEGAIRNLVVHLYKRYAVENLLSCATWDLCLLWCTTTHFCKKNENSQKLDFLVSGQGTFN